MSSLRFRGSPVMRRRQFAEIAKVERFVVNMNSYEAFHWYAQGSVCGRRSVETVSVSKEEGKRGIAKFSWMADPRNFVLHSLLSSSFKSWHDSNPLDLGDGVHWSMAKLCHCLRLLHTWLERRMDGWVAGHMHFMAIFIVTIYDFSRKEDKYPRSPPLSAVSWHSTADAHILQMHFIAGVPGNRVYSKRFITWKAI